MSYGRSIAPALLKAIEDEKKQKRLRDPLTHKEEFIEQFEALRDDMFGILEELRVYMSRLYGINSMIERCEALETTMQKIEADFVKAFKEEEVKDNKINKPEENLSLLPSDAGE